MSSCRKDRYDLSFKDIAKQEDGNILKNPWNSFQEGSPLGRAGAAGTRKYRTWIGRKVRDPHASEGSRGSTGAIGFERLLRVREHGRRGDPGTATCSDLRGQGRNGKFCRAQ